MVKILRIGIILILVFAILLSNSPVMADSQNGKAQAAADRILVKFKPGIGDLAKQLVHGKYGASLIEYINNLDVAVVKIPYGLMQKVLDGYRSENAILFAEPDYIATASVIPSDTYFNSQWALTKIEAPQAWDITTGSNSIKIAILDTGIDQNHPDLASKITLNRNFTTSSSFDDLYGHGTHCAGIAAAVTNNSTGVAGVGYNCVLMNGKILDDNGSGYYSWIANGITWAADNGAQVINLSLGGTSGSSTLQSAVDYAWNKGVVVVAAAGNNGRSSAFYPAYYTNCIAVGATDQNDAKASFSNYGTWVDVAAPGVSIYSTLPNHSNSIGGTNYGNLSGTSMSTPFVAGLTGLVWSTAYGTSNSSVRSRIESTAEHISGTGTYTSNGRIDAASAVGSSSVTLDQIVIAPTSATITAGASQSYTVQAFDTLNNSMGFVTGSSTFGITAGAGGSWSGATYTSANAGTWTVTAGYGGKSVTSSLTVNPVAGVLGRIVISPTSSSITAGASQSYTVQAFDTLNNSMGFVTGSSTFGITAGAGGSWSGATYTSANAGTWTVTAGYGGKSVTSSLTVNPVAGVLGRIVISPTSSSITAGASQSYTVQAFDTLNNSMGFVTGSSTFGITAGAGGSWSGATYTSANAGTWTVTAGYGGKSVTSSLTVNPVASNKLHVKGISLSYSSFFSYVTVRTGVTIVDAVGNVVSGATVSGHWSNTVTGNVTGTTSSSGIVTFLKSWWRTRAGAVFTFTVDNIQLSGWTYDQAANLANSASITIP